MDIGTTSHMLKAPISLERAFLGYRYHEDIGVKLERWQQADRRKEPDAMLAFVEALRAAGENVTELLEDYRVLCRHIDSTQETLH